MVDITIKSFNGFDLDDATYTAWFPGGGDAIARVSSPIILPIIGGYARAEGFEHAPASFQMGVSLSSVAKAAIDGLMRAFSVGQAGELVVEFDGEERIRDCQVEAAYPFAEAPSAFLISLVAADPRWRSATEQSVSEAITASGETWTVTNDGNATDDKPVFTMTPTTNKAAANAFRFRRHVVYVNRVNRSLSDLPIDVTNGGIDHAALVTATKSQADGDDLRVLVDGVEVPRFFGEHANTDPNSTTTKIWATVPTSAMQEARLYAAITNVSPANDGELEVLAGVVESFPKVGALKNESSAEVITYSGWTKRNANGRAAFTGIKRAQRGTTAASGSASDQLLLVERKVEIIYGYSGAAAPEARPDLKPALNLSSSTLTNLRHEWINHYDDLYPTRPGQWSRHYEARDNAAHRIFLPDSPSGAAAAVTFQYNYRSPLVGWNNYNTIRRAFPTGTKGSAGQVGFTRTVDSTLVARLLGVTSDGQELELETFRGPLTAATYASAWLNKAYELGLYVASQALITTPEVDTTALADSSSSFVVTVHETNAVGNKFQKITNDTGEVMIVRKVAVLAWMDGTPRDPIIARFYTDDGDGAPSALVFSSASITLPATIGWTTVDVANPFPLMPGASIHFQLINVADVTISRSLWQYAPIQMNDNYYMFGVRLMGDGAIAEYARGEGGSTAGSVAPDDAAFDAITVDLDTTGVPSITMKGESDCYWFNGRLMNNTTGQYAAFNVYVTTNDVLELDVGARTFRNLTTGEDLLYGVTFSDPGAWIALAAGGNEFAWTEVGVVGMTVDCDYRNRWE